MNEPDDWDRVDTMPGADEFYDDLDDGMLEAVLIISLAAALMILIMYRRRRQDERERQQQQQGNVDAGAANPNGQQGQQDRGLFPQPGDPMFPGWVAGGVGH